jgi:UDP-N-acetylglucosamine 2-epimerase (non-hydrolysing)
MIHVFIGTKAQYIKTAPLLRLMDAQIVPYRLIDSGQHASLSTSMRQDLGVREPDYLLGGDRDVTSIPQAIVWMLSLAKRLISARRLRSEVFGGESGVCVVHGDTPSTLLATLMAKHAGMAVAHLEAGLRSRNVFHPFPEELVRMIVMRRADVLFAPDDDAIANLDAMNVRGRIVRLDGNTSLEAVRHVAPTLGSDGPVVVTMHRVENLHRATRRRGFVALVRRVAPSHSSGLVSGRPSVVSAGALETR